MTLPEIPDDLPIIPEDSGEPDSSHQFYAQMQDQPPKSINLPTEEEVNEMAKRLGFDQPPF